jgi:arylsulfatase
VSTPWELGLKPSPDVITGYNWELYNIKEDFSQASDLAAQMPEKLKELQDLFYVEAKKHDVLPLDNSTLARFLTPRPSPTGGDQFHLYRRAQRRPAGVLPEHSRSLVQH